MASRRVLITGLSTFWGGRLARAVEQKPEVEAIIGVDNRDPTVELERTEFVRVGAQHALIRRIVQAAEIDTVIDTRLVVDSTTTSPALAHENNVIGTMNILAGCSGADSPVRRLVLKSSAHWYGCEQDDPSFFTEEMDRPHPPRTPIEKDIVEAERAVSQFAASSPGVSVTILRFANGLGPDIRTAHTRVFDLPVVPTILGFDPRYQFIHEDDIVGCLEHAVAHETPGIFNCAADGVLALSEVLDLIGRRGAPILPPFGTKLAVQPWRRLGLRIPDEMLNQLRYGRGLDNRKLKAAGFGYRYTTREAVIEHGEAMRLRPLLRGAQEPYRYEQEVEEFLRWSPSVRRTGDSAGKAWRPSPTQVAELQKALSALDSPPAGPEGTRNRPAPSSGGAPEYEDLGAEEVIAVLGSLVHEDLEALRRHESAHARRPEVLEAIDRTLGISRAPERES